MSQGDPMGDTAPSAAASPSSDSHRTAPATVTKNKTMLNGSALVSWPIDEVTNNGSFFLNFVMNLLFK